MPNRLAERLRCRLARKRRNPLDQQRVLGERCRLVDERIECVVVAGSRHAELVPAGLALGAGELPPLTLESKDLRIPDTQLADRIARISVLMGDDSHIAI